MTYQIYCVLFLLLVSMWTLQAFLSTLAFSLLILACGTGNHGTEGLGCFSSGILPVGVRACVDSEMEKLRGGKEGGRRGISGMKTGECWIR